MNNSVPILFRCPDLGNRPQRGVATERHPNNVATMRAPDGSLRARRPRSVTAAEAGIADEVQALQQVRRPAWLSAHPDKS